MDISFVVIGYNEAAFLKRCLLSIRNADLNGIKYELIYVDGGSQDNSCLIADSMNIDKRLGGEKRRKAAENRNLGMKAARGRFVQFVDGDMTLHPSWPATAINFLRSHSNVASVCGHLKEVNSTTFYKALQIDWAQAKGAVDFCGGAAMWRRDVLNKINGFPESVQYGEEPYLCWRIRNEFGYEIHFIDRIMADHNLDYSGFGDYWRRNVRCGQTYAEISTLCFSTKDRLWLRETISNFFWASLFIFALMLVLMASFPVREITGTLLLMVFFRKTVQFWRRGNSWMVSFRYATHVYFSKFPQAYGQLRWYVYRAIKTRKQSYTANLR